MPRRVARTDPPPEDAAPIEAAIADDAVDAVDAVDAGGAGDGLDLGDPNVRPHADRDDEADEIDDGDPTDAPDPKALTNGRLARVFHEIGDILELKGEIKFKTVAYHRAADAIARAPFDVAGAYRAATEAGEKPPPISGVGAAISDKLVELSTTGRLAYHERLRAEIPPSLVGLLRSPGSVPRPSSSSTSSWGSRRSTICGRPPRRTRSRASRACRRAPSSGSSTASGASNPSRAGSCISRAQALADDLVAYLRSYEGVARRAHRGQPPAAQGDHRRPGPARRDRPAR